LRVENHKITWVSGWASDISIWKGRILKFFPKYSHSFIDYCDLISGNSPDDFWDKNPKSLKAGIVVGWSMGTLALLRNLYKKPKEQKWILVCPIADFCAPGCWPCAAVKSTTLTAFFALMCDVSEKDRAECLENALRYSTKQLETGLVYLMRKKADFADISEPPDIKLIFGGQDRVVPLAQKRVFTPLLSKKKLQVGVAVHKDLGHWLPDYFPKLPLI